MFFPRWVPIVFLLFFTSLVHAVEQGGQLPYTLSTRTSGPVTVTLEQVPYLTEYNRPYSLAYTVANGSSVELVCSLAFTSTDSVKPFDGKVTDRITRKVVVPAGKSVQGTFEYQAAEGTYRSVHYPLTVRTAFTSQGKNYSFDTIRVVETDLPALKTQYEPTRIQHGGVSLLGKNYEASYKIEGESEVKLGPNWTGQDPRSKTTTQCSSRLGGTQLRQAFSVHPPYAPKGGSLFLRFPVELPKEEDLTLLYGCCVPYGLSQNGRSDGVTFRISAILAKGNRLVLDQYHTTSGQWDDREVDLSSVAGQACTLELEIHPGPKNSTSFDSAAVSGLVINPGRKYELETDRTKLGHYEFELEDKRTATVRPGPNGLLDASITISSPTAAVTYNGIRLGVGELDLNNPSVRFVERPQLNWEPRAQILTCQYRLLNNDRIDNVTLRMRAENGLFLIELPQEGNPDEVARLEIGPADKKVKRVCFGHGYVVANPRKKVRIPGGGSLLSTRHIGVEYEGGPSILSATSFPPDSLNVDPDKNICSLEITGPTTLAFLPSKGSMFDGAIEFRKRCPWLDKPGPGVARKAGRLVFDVWGKPVSVLSECMRQLFDYGLTDSLFLMHSWQRYGYDVRLPNIWEDGGDNVINPRVGTISELRQLCDLCARHGVPFGLHDNYTDYYPDAENFSFRYINFNKNGQPQKAWLNPGRARSYKWRCDLVQPFLRHNLEMGKKYLPAMDAYFIDVLSAANVSSFYTQEGQYRPRAIMQNAWKDMFLTVSRTLSQQNGNNVDMPGITVSESGDDFLIGALDGADAEWSEIHDKRLRHTIYFPCDDWERVPWFPAVNHTNFSRHGAGYSHRYQNTRSKASHGICSDDYITSEMLGGLSPMVDVQSLYPQAIRKYYLQQHIAGRLAKQEIEKVEFEQTPQGEDIHRQTITWSDGTVVRVNRGKDDFRVGSFTLPRYSYCVFDKNEKFLSGIFRNPSCPSEVVEAAESDKSFYMNGRGYGMSTRYLIEPKLAHFEQVGNTSFKVAIDWHAETPLPIDAYTFVHIYQEPNEYRSTGWYAGVENPDPPTSKWGMKNDTGEHAIVRTGNQLILRVPKSMPDGKYQILVGLFDPKGDFHKFGLKGNAVQGERYSIGTVEIKRKGEKIEFTVSDSEVKSPESPDTPEAYRRTMVNRVPFTWRGVTTRGALLVTAEKNAWHILPIPTLPALPAFDITLDESVISHKIVSVESEGRPVNFKKEGTKVHFSVTAKNAIPWRVLFAPE